MNEFLKKIGLFESLQLELAIDRKDFEKALQENVDPPDWEMFEAFSRSRNLYKGQIAYDNFELRRRRRLFERRFPVTAKGRFTQAGSKLIVDIDMNGFHFMVIPYVLMLVVAYTVLGISFAVGFTEREMWVFPFLLLHAILMFGIPYFVLRRNLRITRENIERDIHFMIKDKLR